MSEIGLTGLRADVPIGVMAAFGVLRVCERTAAFRGSKLRWVTGQGGDHAVLDAPGSENSTALVAALIADVGSAAERQELNWSEQIKTVTRDEFRNSARAALEDGGEASDWFPAFGNELKLDREGKIDSTPFDMSVARQKFVADARKLALGLIEDSESAYREALFGPWTYGDDQHSLGWDPGTMKLGAFTHRAPTKMPNSGVRAAVWLAFESLPLFPHFGKDVVGFRRRQRDFTLCWPVWTPPVSLSGLKTLLAWDGLVAAEPPLKEMKARGLTAIYRSQKFKPNKYLSSFQSPELAASVGA